MDYFGNIDPAFDMARTAARFSSRADRSSAAKEFATLFYSEIMKQAFGSGTGIFSSDEKNGIFGGSAQMRDVFMDQFVQEIISSGGLGAEIAGGAPQPRPDNIH